MKDDFNDSLLRLIISGFSLTKKGDIIIERDFLVFRGIKKDSIPSLISQNKKNKTGKWVPYDSKYFYLDSIPGPTRAKLKLEFNEEQLKEILVIHGNCDGESVLEQAKKTGYINMLQEIENYPKYIYNFYDDYVDNQVRHQKALTLAILRAILPLVQKFKKGLINYFFVVLKNEKKAIDERSQAATKDKFELIRKPVEFEIPLTSQNYFYKYLKRMLRLGIPRGLVHQGKGKPSNHLKLTQVIKDIIIYLKSYGNPTSGSDIHNDLKNWFRDNPELSKNEKLPDVDTVRDFLATSEATNLTTLSTMGYQKFESRILGYLPLDRPKYPLSKVSMDGYYVQVICEDKELGAMSFVGFFIQDNFSDAIWCDFDDSENFKIIGRVWEDFLISNSYRFPYQVVCDKFTDTQTKCFPNLRKFIEDSGVIWDPNSDPKAKAKLERWFGTWQSVALSKIVGYRGEGIRSKRPFAHPSRDVLLVISKKDFLKGKNEVKRLLKSSVDDYNKNAFFEGANAPFTVHRLKKPIHAKQLQPYHPAYFFWTKHQVTISGSMVIVREEKKRWYYRDTDFNFSLKNGTRVDVYHNPDDDKLAYIFEEGTDKFISSIRRHYSAQEAKAEQTVEDKKIIASFGISKKKLHQDYIDEIDGIRTRLIDAGIDPDKLRQEADFKKLADQYDGYRAGIASPTQEPNLEMMHRFRKPGSRSRKKTNIEAVAPKKKRASELIDTF